ncbi:MAG: hypothetical protein NXH82_04545 [Rhodobacteraceae bacterium]|nr:hypothetical protein [Paracoccaceae bacterium]
MTLSRIALPLGLLSLAAAGLGVGLGWQVARLDETTVIGSAAAHYVAEAGPGASPHDCVAYPGRAARVWLVVACAHPDGRQFGYRVSPLGVLRAAPPPDRAPRT